jgi:hypothetical protein
MLKDRQSGAELTGIDGDPEVLRIAPAKADSAGIDAGFDEGLLHSLPYDAGRFDRALSSLFFHLFHHMQLEAKADTLAEVHFDGIAIGGAIQCHKRGSEPTPPADIGI